MENITLQSMLNEFSKKNSITGNDTYKFEQFVNYCLLANDYYDSYNSEQVGTNECVGVDTATVSINGALTYSEEEAKIATNVQFDCRFIFIQTKTSSKLDLGDYLKFLNTILLFFTGELSQQPKELEELFKIKKHIYEKASRFRDYSPSLDINYIYTGIGKIEDSNFEYQVNNVFHKIRDIPYYFSNSSNNLIGATALADRYKETLNRTTKSLFFHRHIVLPRLSSAKEAYLGVVKCSDYIEILKNQNGSINKGIFYDNVRDYLGATNRVNLDIEETIKSDEQRNLFSVLNNGVTVVAKKVTPGHDAFQISGFQVVNGCQTSHVLFNNRKYVTDDMFITVKLIETDDVDLSSSVIKATNSQSLVMKEAFATIKPYHKRLEDFFKSMHLKGYDLYYERRPHQFDDFEDISSNQIVSAPSLIKSFVSVIIEEPHKVHFYYGQILQDYNNEKTTLVFDENHHPGLYFISQIIVSKAKEVAIRHKLNIWHFHIALLIKKILKINLNVSDKFNDNAVLGIVKKIEDGILLAANDAVQIVKSAHLNPNDKMYSEKTDLLIKLYKEKYLNTSCRLGATTPSSLKDGVYVVNGIKLNKNNLNFKYGPSDYCLPIHKTIKLNNITRATITVKDNCIVDLTN